MALLIDALIDSYKSRSTPRRPPQHPSRDLPCFSVRKPGDPRERVRKRKRRGSAGTGGGGRVGNERREWIGELEQRKLITRPVAFSWLDYLVTGERGERPSDWSNWERSFADAIFDFARPNGSEKFNLTGCLIEQRAAGMYYASKDILFYIQGKCSNNWMCSVIEKNQQLFVIIKIHDVID